MATKYWVGGGASANWNATGNTNWAATSGGANNVAVPTASDDVFFDVNSGSNACTISAAALCRSWTITSGYTGTITHNASVGVTVGTSTAASSNQAINWSGAVFTYTLGSATSSAISLTSTVASTQQTVNLAGYTTGNLSFTSATTSSYQLIANLGCATLTLAQGGLYLNGYTVTSTTFTISGTSTRLLDMTNATVNCTVWTATTTTNLTVPITVTGSTINNNVTTTVTFNGGGLTYNNVNIGETLTGQKVAIAGSNTFANLSAVNAGYANFTLQITSGTTQTVTGTFTSNGSTGNATTVSAATADSRGIISAAVASVSNTTFTDMQFIGACVPVNATNTCVNTRNNSGLQFNANYDVIQQTTPGTGLASTATSPAIATTTGNMLVAIITENQTGNTWTVSDATTGNNTWTAVGSVVTNTNQSVNMYYAKNITGNAAETVTVTSTGITSDVAIIVYECIGMDLSSPLDKAMTGSTTGASPVTGLSGTLSQADEIVIGGLISADTTPANYSQAGGKGVLTPYPVAVGAAYCIVANYVCVAATTSLTAQFKDNTSVAYAICAATFKYTATVASTTHLLSSLGAGS